MPLFPAAKGMDTIIGVDSHAGPGIPVHPFTGPITLWHTPKFPLSNVFVNNMPACSVGATAVMPHAPTVSPAADLANMSYWNRRFINLKMGQALYGLTLAGNVAVSMITSLMPKPKSTETFIKDVTGIKTSSLSQIWQSIKTNFTNFSQWQKWNSLLMNPLPYPGGQGCTAAGSSSVTVNGGPMAFAGPLNAVSCSDLLITPNATVVGFSNVLVGVSYNDMIKNKDDLEFEEKKKFTLRMYLPKALAEVSKAKVTLTSNKGYRQEKQVKSDWKEKGEGFGDIVFTDLVVKDAPKENPKYTLKIDYGYGAKPGVIFKDMVYGEWMTIPDNVTIQHEK